MVLNSKWAPSPIALTDSLLEPVWADTNHQKLPVAGNVWLYLRNDGHNMYLAIDMPDETNNDPSGDYFWLSFDVNKNGSINPNKDINYGINSANPGKVVKQFYLNANQWTGIVGTPGEYVFDFESSPQNATPHKVWKLKIPLADFGINLSLFNIIAWMGLKIHVSGHEYEFPAHFSGIGFNKMNQAVLVFARNAIVDPALMGPVIAAVGLIPTASSIIDPSNGRASTASGYYVKANKSAFGGNLNLIFNHNTVNGLRAAGAVKYKVLHGLVGGTQSELRSAWYNYRWVGNDVVLDAFGPDGAGFYTLPDPLAQYSIQDLLVQFNSGLLPNGKYQFAVEFYDVTSTKVSSPVQNLVLYIDNSVPVVGIDLIAKSTTPGINMSACEFAELANGEGLVFKITATDPEGDIDSFGLAYAYGNGSGSIIYSDAYNATKPAGWIGVSNFVVPVGGAAWIPPVTCAYAFTVSAYSRTTNGYGQIGYNSVSRMLTIIKH